MDLKELKKLVSLMNENGLVELEITDGTIRTINPFVAKGAKDGAAR